MHPAPGGQARARSAGMSLTRLALTLLLASLILPVAGCPTTDDDDATAEPDLCEGVDPVSGTDVELELIAAGLERPVDIANAGDGSNLLFVVEQGGVISEVRPDDTTARTWFDINDRVVTTGGGGDERGLLSMTFHPDYANNGKFYVHYNDNGSDTIVSEFTAGEDGGDANSERVLLTVDQPASNHNGGSIKFGPDGYLYIGLGDGGGAGDTYGNGQNPDTLLAKILRIDVNTDSGYLIPADNPFLAGPVVDEAWMWGMRNPWRFSFDRETGQLWVADVGQNQLEEIDVGVAGANFGWPAMEGTDCYDGPCDGSYEPPVYEYRHTVGTSITGGFVYRGCKMPDLHGNYFFSDFPYAPFSPLWSIKNTGGGFGPGDVWEGNVGLLIATFGEDEQGELLTADYDDGDLYRMVPASR